MYKIASLETSDHALIKIVSETGKPTIISTGATHFDEIRELVEVFRSTGNQDLTLLVCTSSYPAKPEDANLRRMELLKEEFGVKVGLSDHTLGVGVAIAAISLGAVAIEKHLTLKRSDGGADGAFSMEPREFQTLVYEGNTAKSALGSSEWKIQQSENESRRLRRSLYIVQNVNEGDLVTKSNVRAIRPGGGSSPAFLGEVIGKKFKNSDSTGTPLTLDKIEIN